jgi:hypothetical protein
MTDKYEAVVVSIVVILALSVTLGGLAAFATGTNSASTATNLVWIGGASYNSDNVSVALPPTCQQPAMGNLTTYAFHGVTFELRITAWCNSAGGLLNISAAEANGATFHSGLAGISGPTGYLTWISPDHYCGVEWDRGVTAILLVMT